MCISLDRYCRRAWEQAHQNLVCQAKKMTMMDRKRGVACSHIFGALPHLRDHQPSVGQGKTCKVNVDPSRIPCQPTQACQDQSIGPFCQTPSCPRFVDGGQPLRSGRCCLPVVVATGCNIWWTEKAIAWRNSPR